MNNFISLTNCITTWIFINKNILIDYTTNLIIIFIILFLTIKITKFIGHIIKNFFIIKNIDSNISYFLSIIIRYTIITFVFIILLNKFGIQTTSIITVIGTVSLTIGLSLQNSLKNFIAGILLVILKLLKTGDYVIIGDNEGFIKKIQFFSTIIKTLDNCIIMIPNNKIIKNSIINFSKDINKPQNISIIVSYNLNTSIVKKIISNIIFNDKRIQNNKEIIVRLHKISHSSLEYLVRFWTTNDNMLPVYWDLLENFKYELDIYNSDSKLEKINIYIYKNITMNYEIK